MKRCPQCGWGGPPTTNRDDGLCYECANGRRIERHHPWNLASFPELKATIPVPSNVNQVLGRLLTERCEVLKRPGADPLHRIAAASATIGEGADAIADYGRRNGWPAWFVEIARLFAKAAKSAAHWLLMLAGALAKAHGEGWVSALGMPQWQPPEQTP
jgi:hypothetical protein